MNWEGVCNGRLTEQFMSLTTRTKVRVFGSNVKIVLLYGAETWRLTKELNQKMQVFFNKCLRIIL